MSQRKARNGWICLNGANIEYIALFKYLGSILTDNGPNKREIKARKDMEKKAFTDK